MTYWLVTLHHKNAYLPGFRTAFGNAFQTTPIKVNGTSNIASFYITRSETTYLDVDEDKQCVENDIREVDLEECLAEYFQSKIGCSYPWLSKNSSLEPCRSTSS